MCANKAESRVHRSVHLVRSAGLDENEASISWSAYEGIEVESYKVMVTIDGNEELYTSVPSESGRQNYAVVYNSHKPGNRYRVVFDLPNTIAPSALKSDSGPFSQSLSNLSEAIALTGGELNTSFEAKIYPVPAQNYVTVSFTAHSASDYRLRILATDGRTVFEKSYKATDAFETTVPMIDSPAGIYTVELTSAQGVFQKQFAKE
jgi:hypothetical protein